MPYPGSTRSVKGPIGMEGAAGHPTFPRKTFLPLSAFFLQMQQGEEEEDTFVGKKRQKKGKKGARKAGEPKKTKGGGEPSEPGKTPGEGASAGPGKDQDAIGQDAAQGSAPKGSVKEGKRNGFFDRPHKCHYCKAQATKGYGWAEHRAVIPVCQDHEKKARHQIEVVNKDEVSRVVDLPQSKQEARIISSWKRASGGYTAKTSVGEAKLHRKGRNWVLSIGEKGYTLGRKASFDHAEGIIEKLSEGDVQASAQEAITPLGLGGARLAPSTASASTACPRCKGEMGSTKDCPSCWRHRKGELEVDEATVAANVATTAVPIGEPLRRVFPNRKKKSKTKKQRKEWSKRIAALADSSA